MELKRKAISKANIDIAFKEISDDDYIASFNSLAEKIASLIKCFTLSIAEQNNLILKIAQ